MFKRRQKRSTFQKVSDSVYPRGGWLRALSYVYYRLRRLPDPPHRIARGIACGVFVSFSPFFGFHFVYAALCALVVRGNVLASVLATFVGNPLTFPFMAAISLAMGEWIMGTETSVPLPQVFHAFSNATAELWINLIHLVTGEPSHWGRLEVFFDGVFLPYMVGSLVPGLVAGIAAYFLSYPMIEAYKKRRARVLQKKLAAKLAASRTGA